jgi:hypothetical protein
MALTPAKAEKLREQLAEFDREQAEQRAAEMNEKYQGVSDFIASSEVEGVLKTADDLTGAFSGSAEDRNLFYALENVKTAFRSVETALAQRIGFKK